MRVTKKGVLSLCLAIAAVTTVYALARGHLLPSCEQLHATIQGWGPAAPLGYLTAATVALMVFVPRTLLVVLAGIAFPPVEANVLVMTSSLVAACLGFWLARYAARGTVERLMARHRTFEKLSRFVHANELSFVTITRLVHFLPYSGVNYASGILPITFSTYVLGTFLGLLPGTIGLVYAGDTVGCMLVNGDSTLPPGVGTKLLVGGTVLSLLAAVPAWISHRKGDRKRLERRE